MGPRNEDQKEFFEEFKKAKSGIERIREKYIWGRRLFITVSVENLVFATIAIIMIIVIFFSLGVERGKHISTSKLVKIEKEVNQPARKTEDSLPVHKTLAKYTIQIVTYKDESTAERKVALLKKQGFVAFIIPKDDLFQICVGKYKTQKEAKADLKKLRNQYNDCFVRKTE